MSSKGKAMNGKKIIVAVTGASGSLYAARTLEALFRADDIAEIALIVSDNGRAVMEWERVTLPAAARVREYANSDMFAPPASGSADYDAMVIVPCSMGTLGRVAAGVSSGLIERAADVMLKERRTLILVTRETPLGTIHLRNMTALSECGAVILPASPSFYSHPGDIGELCDTVVERIMKMLGIAYPHYRWGEK